ncbi:MAG: IPT/TIG domain-containing protein [Dehalococcoidia bacterium]
MRTRVFSMMSVLAVMACAVLLLPNTVRAAENPAVTSMSPTSGSVLGGTVVTLLGSSFQPGAVVFFGGAPATSVNVESATRITAVTPRSTVGAANVVVRNPDGGAVALNGAFFFSSTTSDVTVTGLSTTSGPTRGGTAVTLNGTGFSGSVVLFGGVPAPGVNVLGPSAITLRTPPGVTGTVNVTVLNGDGVSVTLPNAFTYEPGGLEVSSITPGGGLAAGGAPVRISGYAFTPGTRVLFGTAEARDVALVNSTLITATSPASIAGTVNVQVVRPDGATASLTNGFTFREAAAAAGFAVSGLSTTSGASTGGTRLDVMGTGFSGGATVYFGTAPANVISIPGPSTITVTTPPNVAGSSPVTVVNADGSSTTFASGFRYEGGNGVAVTSVSPTSGATGTVVAVTGVAFVSGATVSVNGVPASNVWVVGDSLAYATVPAGSGTASVTVTNPGGPSATLTNSFTYQGGSGTPATPPVTPTTPPSGSQTALPARGFGLFVFAGGSNAQLTASVACTASTLAFWATNAAGEFDTFIPGASIAAVNAGWNARFPNGVPAGTPLIGRCQS